MNKRIIKGTAFTLLLMFFYLTVVFPVNHFVNGSQLFVRTLIVGTEEGLHTSSSLYGVIRLNTSIEKSAYIGGFPVAMALYTDGVIIEEISTVDTFFGKATPGLQLDKGDLLIELNGEKVEKTGDIERILTDYAKTLNLNDAKKTNPAKPKTIDSDLSKQTQGSEGEDGTGLKQDVFRLPYFPELYLARPPQPQAEDIPPPKKRTKALGFVKKLAGNIRREKKTSLDTCENSGLRNSVYSNDAAHFLDNAATRNDIGKYKICIGDNNAGISAAAGTVSATVLRGKDKKTFWLQPAVEEFSDNMRLGLVVRDYILGIGMVSFVKEDGSFGALGHAISDSLAGRVPIRGGHIFNCEELSIVKGERGKPGEFRVKITSMKNPIGIVEQNNDSGIFGKFNSVDIVERFHSKEYNMLTPVAPRRRVKMGSAHICTTIGGVTDLYKIDIIKTINQNTKSDKGLVIKINDKRLIDKTGGIIQGMSGSPIIQNGMLVGVVTHVFVNDPTRGYGMYMDFMCEG
ncbi:MAG: hypothetical protein FWC82_02675 [Firmicutes bacterium]|nr:hypothetical protein [Bacillota bacterium]